MATGPANNLMPQLVPLQAMMCGPADLGSLDSAGICFCGDDGGFVVKNNQRSPTLAHSEWFCSTLASMCGVPQVNYNIIQHTDETLCFGSLWQKGKVKDWWLLAQDGEINFSNLADDISRIYALDLFIHNVDRHMNNYMVVNDGNTHRVYSFDYSRAWIENGLPIPEVMADNSIPTVRVRDWLKAQFGDYLNVDVANEVLSRISDLSSERIAQIISGHPKEWLDQGTEDAIISWWGEGHAASRIDIIQKGLGDGTYI